MRVSKEFKEVLFKKITESSNKAQKKHFNNEIEKIIYDLTLTYKAKIAKCAVEAIKEVEDKHLHKFKEENLEEIKKRLIHDSMYGLGELCISKQQEKSLDLCSKIRDQAEKEKQDLILKLPFLKKEEELKEYMKGIEDRLNAI